MKQYRINTMDVCTSGFERLRSNSEFIILACITAEVTFEELKAELIADISSCERPDGFDYPAAMRDVGSWLDDNVKPAFDRRANPFGIEKAPEDDDEWNYCNFYLYVQETVNETETAE